MVNLKKLNAMLHSCQANLEIYTKLIKKVNVNDPSTYNIQDIKTYKRICSPLLSELSNICIDIQVMVADDNEEMARIDQIREEFNIKYLTLESIFNEILIDSNPPPVSFDLRSNHNTDNDIELPRIGVPDFHGDISEWHSFKSSYVSLIHSQNRFNNYKKLHLLRSCLKGAALDIITSIEIEAKNYELCWNLILEAYDNKRKIISHHIKSFLNIPNLITESSDSLRTTAAAIRKHVKALENSIPLEHRWNQLVTVLTSQKLDATTKAHWQSSPQSKTDYQTVDSLLSFMLERAHELDEQSDNFKIGTKSKSQRSLVVAQHNKCHFCSDTHRVYQCKAFLKLSISARIKECQKRTLCLNCLRKGHNTKKCPSTFLCNICNKQHHTLLHLATSQSDSPQPSTSSDTFTSQVVNSGHVLLSTAVVKVTDSNGKSIFARALLDNGSQTSFVTKRLANRLKATCTPTNVAISGIGKTKTNITSKISVQLESLATTYKTSVDCLVIHKITDNIPHTNLDVTSLKIPSHIQLADPQFNKSDRVDLLLGADIFWNLLRVGKIRLISNLISVQKTTLGWIVIGTKAANGNVQSYCYYSQIQNQLSKFWEIESVESCSPHTAEELACEDHFKRTTIRDPTGRFVVTIPFKKPTTLLGNSKNNATKRFLSLEKKLSSDTELRKLYNSFMEEYISLGHMTLNPVQTPMDISYFLPHHGVLKPSSTTSKLRVVFNGSMPTTTGISLNELQANGPTIQSDLFTLLTKFRLYTYVVIADIAMMYRQVLVDSSQRDLQQILWRFKPDEPLLAYRLNTVTYGTAAASFLAIRSLTQLGYESQDINPKAADSILNDFYVDDLITGSDDLAELSNRCVEINTILSSAGFKLRKWIANSPTVLSNMKNDRSDKFFHLDLGDSNHLKTLGVKWNSISDEFKYNITPITEPDRVTKRSILSMVSKIFDPLGLLSPCIIPFKKMMQELWLLKLHWDDEIPSSLHELWISLLRHLPDINNISIPRMVFIVDSTTIELHGFCDASERAYGACIYYKSVNKQGASKVYLVHSKSKVAPLKTLSIPCLELCAALILARMTQKLLSITPNTVSKVFLWSDSTIVLSWLKLSPSTLKVFVANRVAEIQSSMTELYQWRHVPTHCNPADLISRGTHASLLINNNLWWTGPSWLHESSDSWPASNYNVVDIPETREIILSNFLVTSSINIFGLYSNLRTLKRVTAYCLRFSHNCKNRANKTIGPLSVSELQHAMYSLLRLSQSEHFSNEISSLKRNVPLHNSSQLLSLNAFLDNNNIIRVGGRLQHSNFTFDKKHPIILHPKHPLTKLIMQHEHIRLFHSGPQALLFSVRDQFWPLRGISLAKSIVHNCIICFKCKPKMSSPMMGSLPSDRSVFDYPFRVTGVDYAGPVMIKNRYGRGSNLIKSYICLFICFATKAVHLELVTELSTQCFLAALNRFISRRGKPSTIYSDNGTNFIGTNNVLAKFLSNKLNSSKLSISASELSIIWKFIPPRSPHFGGLWESNIKSTKSHLKKVLFNSHLSYEDTYTFLTQIEAILNSRPLYPMSSDPNDLTPITPGHLLIGRQITSNMPAAGAPVNLNQMQRFAHVQERVQQYWKRWTSDYINHCQQRNKWKTSTNTKLHIGSLVMIHEDHLPPTQWAIGRIIKLLSGSDSLTRVAVLKTKFGEITRAVRRLAPLPLDNLDLPSAHQPVEHGEERL